jgi:methanol--5-hydroxybenzimidazolylcobamide Co-methyltransferase
MPRSHSPLRFTTLAFASADALGFGVAPRPVRCGAGLVIGGGQVFPEVNFTLPTMSITDATWKEVRGHYEEIATACLLGRWP